MFNASGANGGTQIQDSQPSVRCWYKTNYRGDPREFGAVGDGSTNDTPAIQNWLGAYGMLLSSGATSTNFGPWVAALPGIYKVNQPLICPANANIQAPANLAAGASTSGSMPFVIRADTNTFPADTTLMTAQAYCRLSGIALDGKATAQDVLDVVGKPCNRRSALPYSCG
jgi:hypothetical protein